jgi:hypothetical protein
MTTQKYTTKTGRQLKDRFVVGHIDAGVICYCETFAEAERIAKKNGFCTTVYDRMADYGAMELWSVTDIGTLELIQRKSAGRVLHDGQMA